MLILSLYLLGGPAKGFILSSSLDITFSDKLKVLYGRIPCVSQPLLTLREKLQNIADIFKCTLLYYTAISAIRKKVSGNKQPNDIKLRAAEIVANQRCPAFTVLSFQSCVSLLGYRYTISMMGSLYDTLCETVFLITECLHAVFQSAFPR